MTAGVPKGLYLKPVFHDLKITKDGTVVEGLDVHGRIIIKANNVTIRNTMVRGSDTGSRNGLIDMTRDFTGLVVEDSEIFATVESYWVNGIIGDHYTLRHVNIHNVIDQAQITGDDVTIEDSWFHDNLHYENDPNQDGTPSHDDSVEMFGGKNVVIRNNVLDDVWNANLQLSQVLGVISDVTFEGNRVNTGFCSINLSQKKLPPIERIVIKDNTFGQDTRHPNCAILRPSTTEPIMENNVYVDGTPVTGFVPG
ncbi:right-handed parallel beta-helix repeat-containing protein [Naasia aerilata]|uniref:Right handed beta helix domain-containing protein n=1 Tax=Naasia aerilata TaxID=1162966 RepID=A0ABN6XLT5_9MICO|nr:right-handed parallel beta-helix repeat-containing protein [Naasia aerilata]BDZ45940.1 hypothetical protein GCM10025866_18490 [Naasia aerilata]